MGPSNRDQTDSTMVGRVAKRGQLEAHRLFLLGVSAYLAMFIGVILILGHNINGQSDSQMFRAAFYGVVVISSWLLSISAAVNALSRRKAGIVRWINWPPEWDGTVAAWSLTKSLFFSVLWCLVAGIEVPEWLINVSLGLFVVAHTMFTAQWISQSEQERTAQ